jgi:hypothetical protein
MPEAGRLIPELAGNEPFEVAMRVGIRVLMESVTAECTTLIV